MQRSLYGGGVRDQLTTRTLTLGWTFLTHSTLFYARLAKVTMRTVLFSSPASLLCYAFPFSTPFVRPAMAQFHGVCLCPFPVRRFTSYALSLWSYCLSTSEL